MANGITIMGGEPYAEWIERDGNAQRLFKAYRDKWPDGDTQCVAIGDEFYVRFVNGDGMRRVYNVGDFDDEDEWCAQCGTPIDTPDIIGGCVAERLSKDAHHPLLAVASPVPGRRRKCDWRHVLGVPPFFMLSACRAITKSNIIIINQTRKGKYNDYRN
jgi:hypothetical protein